MKKYLIVILTLPICFGFNYAQAQKVEEKKVVIITKTIDDKGNVKEERIEKSGAEADQYIKSNVEVQDVVEINKKVEKEVTVEINDENGQMQKTIQIRIKDGKDGEQIMEWEGEDESQMPEEMKNQMKDVEIIIDNSGDKKEENVIIRRNNNKEEKEIHIMIEDDNGNEKIIRWNGEGEMPEQMKELMENEDIVIHSNDKHHKDVKIIRRSNDQDPKIIEWNGEGDLPAEIIEKLEKEGVQIDGENVFIFKGGSDNEKKDHKIIIKRKGDKMEWHSDDMKNDDDVIILKKGQNFEFNSEDGGHVIVREQDLEHEGKQEMREMERNIISMDDGKPRLGVMIENHVDGVEILEVIPGSAAEKAGIKTGDIIYKVGKRNVGSVLQLTDSLKSIKSGESVKIKLLRSGSNVTIKATL